MSTVTNNTETTPNPNIKDLTTRDYFAGIAMQVVMSETQEMRIASVWDWIKHLMFHLLHFTFLSVKYEKIEGVYEDAAQRSYEYADAMLKHRQL